MEFLLTAPASSAAAQVMSLNTLPGSYRSLTALFRHWVCWASCKAALRASPVRASTAFRAAVSAMTRGFVGVVGGRGGHGQHGPGVHIHDDPHGPRRHMVLLYGVGQRVFKVVLDTAVDGEPQAVPLGGKRSVS